MACGSGGCWLCAGQGALFVAAYRPNDDVDPINAWGKAVVEVPEVTLVRHIQEESDRKRRTSGTAGLQVQACSQLERYGFEVEGLLCADDAIFNYFRRGDCKYIRFYPDRTNTALFYEFPAKISQLTGTEYDIDEGTEVEWSATLECVDLTKIVEPVWPTTARDAKIESDMSTWGGENPGVAADFDP